MKYEAIDWNRHLQQVTDEGSQNPIYIFFVQSIKKFIKPNREMGKKHEQCFHKTASPKGL